MQPGLDTVSALRAQIGLLLVSLARAADWQPFVLVLAFFLLGVLPALLGARKTRQRFEAEGHPWGAAYLSAAICVGAPLLALFVVDRLLAAAHLDTLEKRLLDVFSPAVLVKDNSGPIGANLILATLPAATALCLVGLLALWAYLALFRLGGPFVTGKGTEANGLMRLAGLWAARGPEKRFGLWAGPLSRAIFGITVASLPAAVVGHLPPVLWIAAAVLAHGFLAAGAQAARPARVEEKAAEEAAAAKPSSSDPAPKKVEDDLAHALDASAFLAHAQDRAAAIVEKAQVPSPDLFAQILEGLGAKGLYRHQAKAIEAYFAGEHVALFTPPHSGRKVVRDSLAMHAVLAEGSSVLYLCRDAAEADRAHALFRSRSEKAHWKWNVPVLALSGRESLDLDRVQPAIVFASWADVHGRLLADAARYRFFLRSLELVAVTHVHGYQGPSADHLTYLVARLRRAVREAAGAAAVVGPRRARPRLLLMANPVSPDVPRLLERVAAQRVTLIGEELDGAPASQLRHVWLTRADGSVPEAAEAAAAIQKLGVPWVSVGLEAQLGRPQEKAEPRKAQAVLVRADAASVAQLPLMLRHAGCDAKVEAPIAVFWLGMPDPLSRLLPGAKGSALAEKLLAPRIVTGGASERVAKDHARCALAEADWPLDELEATFGAPVAKAAMESVQASRESRCEVDPERGEVRRRDFARARRAQPHRDVALGIVGKALAVEDRATGSPVAFVPADRALAAAFPERIFEREGRRYRVLPVAEQERREQGVIWAEVEAADVVTVPVRRLELELLADRRRSLGDAPEQERRAPARRTLAGREFSLTWPRARIRERIEGFRSVQGGVVTDAALYPEIIDGVHEGRAAVLAFPVQAGWSVPPAALHALVHLFRVALPVVLRAGPDDLDAVDLLYAGDPAIALVDLHPGGGGFAEGLTLDAVRTLASHSLAIVRGCSCRKVGGCPNCVRIPECRSGFGNLGEREPSRKEAERVLCELLDPKLLGAGDAVKYEDDKPSEQKAG